MTLEGYTEYLHQVLLQLNLPDDEVMYRMNRLKEGERRSGSAISCFSDLYFQIAHEIKSMEFLNEFGDLHIAEDSKHDSGCDCTMGDHYQIEFVCSSSGNVDKNGLDKLSCLNSVGHLVDYAKKQDIIFSRFTSSIKEKKDFFESHLLAGTVRADKPYIIFLGLGPLAGEMILEERECGIDFTGFLLGKGSPYITINCETGKTVKRGYSFRPYFEKANGQKIDGNIFCNKEYAYVSAIVISQADLFEQYSTSNTWLFTNPFAQNPITPNDFQGMRCWCADENYDYRVK